MITKLHQNYPECCCRTPNDEGLITCMMPVVPPDTTRPDLTHMCCNTRLGTTCRKIHTCWNTNNITGLKRIKDDNMLNKGKCIFILV